MKRTACIVTRGKELAYVFSISLWQAPVLSAAREDWGSQQKLCDIPEKQASSINTGLNLRRFAQVARSTDDMLPSSTNLPE